jgi:hypothetical protein
MNGGSIFQVDERALIGQGRRRRCYRLPAQELCVKFYRDTASLPPKTRLNVRLVIALGRRCRCANVNHREWRYHQVLKRRLPEDLLAVFPEHTEPVFCPERGWGIVETLILNADGTVARKAVEELQETRDAALGLRIYKETASLLRRLAENSVRFFDPSNILVQWTGDGAFRLRIADFEPSCRALVPGLSHLPLYVRCKVRRRSARYLERLRRLLFARHALPESVFAERRHAAMPLLERFTREAGLL